MSGVRASAGTQGTMTLRWDDGDYVGLEVETYVSASLGLYWQFGREAATLDERIERFARFGREVLVSWNLIDNEDEPIPATSVGMNAIPAVLAWDIVNRWIEEIVGVPDPLEPVLSNGATSTSPSSSRKKSRKSN
jgi:hypothetical protein